MKLSILIPTTRRRRRFLQCILDILYTQLGEQPAITQTGRLVRHAFPNVEILVDPCEHCKIGEKRNELLKAAAGEYVCFVDDDDRVSGDYVETLMTGIELGVDCVSLRGVMTTNGQNPEIFEHSLKYGAYKTTDNPVKYERYPNHLNCIRADIAKRFKFQAKNWGEDTEWATQIHRSGALKTEYYIDKILYFYDYIANK
jgi:glycosyltransferase involved in cell wall biosynthesis